MNPSAWPKNLDEVWAKSPEKGADGLPETLAQHTWSVLERLAEFIRLRPNLPSQVGEPGFWQAIYWGCFLHDFGKVMPAFQDRLRSLPGSKERWVSHRHEVFSVPFLDWIIEGLSDQQRHLAAWAILSHHRDAQNLLTLYPYPEEGQPDLLLGQFEGLSPSNIFALLEWLKSCGLIWAKDLGLDHVGVSPVVFTEAPSKEYSQLAVCSIRKWLEEYQLFWDQLARPRMRAVYPELIALRGHVINADHSASAHVGTLPPFAFKSDLLFECENGLKPDKLYSHQREAASIEGCALLTAPTGSGKTEAALLWALHQAETSNGNLPRLFYTLPYQASMNAMQVRLEKIFDDKSVGLQHSRSLLALYRLLLEKDYTPAESSRMARLSRELGKLNYQPIRIFSPYQMLKGMYRLKGYEALLTDYHNAAFIFDEVHAYEVKRLALILETVSYLKNYYHCHFLVMSATFPKLIKDSLKEVLEGPADIVAAPELFAEFKRHRIEILAGEVLDSNNLDRILRDAQAGKSVLVVCNRVDRAQAVYSALKEKLVASGIPTELLHGRFNMRDRSAKERLVREAAGSQSENRRSIVLVATQVVEVSLDIDLDTIYTEPAPLEALIQRFGRINRRRKQEGLAVVHVFAQPCDGQKVYDPELVQRTMSIAKREDGHPIDESGVESWLDEIYSGEVASRCLQEYQEAASDFRSAVVKTLKPFASDDGLEQEFYRAFDGMEVLPASLHDEFEQVEESNPILADELLVPISYGRYHMLENNGLVFPREPGKPVIVNTSYDREIGLTYVQKSTESWEE